MWGLPQSVDLFLLPLKGVTMAIFFQGRFGAGFCRRKNLTFYPLWVCCCSRLVFHLSKSLGFRGNFRGEKIYKIYFPEFPGLASILVEVGLDPV